MLGGGVIDSASDAWRARECSFESRDATTFGATSSDARGACRTGIRADWYVT
ncbi:hypothetical protein GCM10009626_10220 [Brachybacterium sacelli]